MTNRQMTVALVLTGGGGRAAYQVGVMEALAELNIRVAAVSAVGAGALNAGFLAADPSPANAAANLRRFWSDTVRAPQTALRLGPVPVLRLGVYLTLLFACGVRPEIEENMRHALRHGHDARRAWLDNNDRGVDGDPITQIIRLAHEMLNIDVSAEFGEYLSNAFAGALVEPRIPFYVSVYETPDGVFAPLRRALEQTHVLPIGPPHYIRIDDRQLSPPDRLNAVLASATLPFICETAQLGDGYFVDGSFAGMNQSPGAVPLEPLRAGSRHLDAIVVVQTESGVTWDATQFPGTSIIEVRPSLASDAVLGGMSFFWPDRDKLQAWMATGRSDALAVLQKWDRITSSWERGRLASERLAIAAKAMKDLPDG